MPRTTTTPGTSGEMVNHPRHYNVLGAHCPCGEPVECIQVVEQLPFNPGNTVKYLWRAPDKADLAEDLAKAHWYLTEELEHRTLRNTGARYARLDVRCRGCGQPIDSRLVTNQMAPRIGAAVDLIWHLPDSADLPRDLAAAQQLLSDELAPLQTAPKTPLESQPKTRQPVMVPLRLALWPLLMLAVMSGRALLPETWLDARAIGTLLQFGLVGGWLWLLWRDLTGRTDSR